MSEKANKEQVVESLHEQVDAASAKIDELKLKSHLAKAEAKTAMDESIDSLEQKRDKLRDELRHLKFSSESAWEELADGCNRSWADFKKAVTDAVEKFK